MTEVAIRKRPKWVWAICLFYVLSTIWTLLSFALIIPELLVLIQLKGVFRELKCVRLPLFSWTGRRHDRGGYFSLYSSQECRDLVLELPSH